MPDDGRRRRRGPRWTRSVRRRPAAFVTLLALAALAMAVAVLTPMLLRSVQQVSLNDGVSRAAAIDRSVAVQATSDAGTSPDGAVKAIQGVAGQLSDDQWAPPVQVVATENEYPWRASGRPSVAEGGFVTVAPDSTCGDLVVVSGSCPTSPLEALLPASTAQRLRVALGSTVTLSPRTIDMRELRIVGVYDDARGVGRVLAAPDALSGTPLAQPSGALVIGALHPEQLDLPLVAVVSKSLRQPVDLDAVPAIERQIAAAQDAAASGDFGQVSAEVLTGAPVLLAHLQSQNDAAAVITAAIALEAIALAWFAESALIQRVSRVRAVEWGIGRTRGIVLRDWLATVFAEPLVAVAGGSVLGLPIGVLAATAVARVALGPATPVEPLEAPVAVSAALAVAGSLVALVAASVRSARLPLPALLRETTEPRQLSRFALVAQVCVVVVTLVVVWSVLTQSTISGAQIALLAPSLIALAIGIGALRLTVVLVRGATARPPRSLSGLVVGRQVARAPSALGGAVMVAVGVALAAYVLSLFVVAERMQDDRAASDVGATTVLRVSAPAGTSLLRAVRRADPTGRAAMAVLEQTGFGEAGTARVVAVDTARLDAVTTWRAAWRGPDPAALRRRLDPPTSAAPLMFRGTRLSVAIAGLTDADVGIDRALHLVATFDTGTGWRTADLGRMQDATLTSDPGDVPCARGCRLVSLGLEDPDLANSQSYGESFLATRISTDEQDSSVFASWLSGSARWRQRIVDSANGASGDQTLQLGTPTGLRLTFEGTSSTLLAIEPAVGPETLPALVARQTSAEAYPGVTGGLYGTDLAQGPLVLSSIGRAPVLPRAGGSGVLVDLGQLARVSDIGAGSATEEVWLAPGPQGAVRRALAAEGVRVLGTQHVEAVAAGYRRAAPVRALALMIGTAVAVLLLTLLALVGARSVAGRSRRRDQRTLRAAGFPARTLGRLASVEFAVPTAAGAVLGVLAGVVGYGITVAHLPLGAGDGAMPPPDYAPPVLALLLLAVGGAVAAVLLAAGLGALDSRRGAS